MTIVLGWTDQEGIERVDGYEGPVPRVGERVRLVADGRHVVHGVVASVWYDVRMCKDAVETLEAVVELSYTT